MSYCPSDHYADNSNKFCSKCDEECSECSGPTANDCIKCAKNKMLLRSSNNIQQCVDQCPDGYFLSKIILNLFKKFVSFFLNKKNEQLIT